MQNQKTVPASFPMGMECIYMWQSQLNNLEVPVKIAGKESTYTLGEYPKMSLEQARLARMEARGMVRAGINPVQKRREVRQHEIDRQIINQEAR